ncbi:hypothetical protein MNBD_NITROSPINAE04-2589 [hydrothermal vent metagenome]|uniref:Antitoxin n=1 Tax=hydrothermal vent metagenome TaxID=652676 RepID=A0A3B1BQF3_9ZZZZ
MSKIKQNAPEIVLRDGKPVSVIIDIAEMLKRLEDAGDLRKLEDFLSDRAS